MNLIETFQNLVAQVPELLQPLVVALAAAVPFVEGEGATAIGIIGGIHPVVATIAAIVGNFLCVTVLVLASSGARKAIVDRKRTRRLVTAGGGEAESTEAVQVPAEPASPRKEKFQRAFVRYGVPGVSLLGPLLLPTQFTATMLAAAGINKARILFWQAVAITGWATITAIIAGSAVHAIH
jgi:hypothetical protein